MIRLVILTIRMIRLIILIVRIIGLVILTVQMIGLVILTYSCEEIPYGRLDAGVRAPLKFESKIRAVCLHLGDRLYLG
jgi:hypothetical protein